MSDPIGKADDLVREADKIVKSWSFLRPKSEKYEDASALYKQAGNIYKASKQNTKAIDAYKKATESYAMIDDTYEKIQTMIEIAKLYRTENKYNLAVEYFNKAINCMLNAGNTDNLGRIYQDIAETYERCISASQHNDNTGIDSDVATLRAIEAYQNASDAFLVSDRVVHSNEILLKASYMCIQSGLYNDALKMLEKIINNSETSGKNLWSISRDVMKAVLCSLACEDIGVTEDKLDTYRKSFPRFDSSTEDDILKCMVESINANDVDMFESQCIKLKTHDKTDYNGKVLYEIKTKYFQNETSSCDVPQNKIKRKRGNTSRTSFTDTYGTDENVDDENDNDLSLL